MNVSGFDMIYKECVYKCIEAMTDFSFQQIGENDTAVNPKFLHVTCIDSDGQVVCFHDETFMFRFIRKGRESNG